MHLSHGAARAGQGSAVHASEAAPLRVLAEERGAKEPHAEVDHKGAAWRGARG